MFSKIVRRTFNRWGYYKISQLNTGGHCGCCGAWMDKEIFPKREIGWRISVCKLCRDEEDVDKMEHLKLTKENAQEFMDRMLKMAREMEVKYKILEDGDGGFYIKNLDGSEKKLSFEEVLGIKEIKEE